MLQEFDNKREALETINVLKTMEQMRAIGDTMDFQDFLDPSEEKVKDTQRALPIRGRLAEASSPEIFRYGSILPVWPECLAALTTLFSL